MSLFKWLGYQQNEEESSSSALSSVQDSDGKRVKRDNNQTLSTTTSVISRMSQSISGMLGGMSKTRSMSSDSSESEKPSGSNQKSLSQKLNNTWLMLKYQNWNSKSVPTYDRDCPVWLLGLFYAFNQSDLDDDSIFRAFLLDYYSRIWLTYRTSLSPFKGSSKTSDCGWGCMLRSCQMMVAQALTLIHLGREWRFHGTREVDRKFNGPNHFDIISLFGDDSNAQLGIHRLIEIANREVCKAAGSWYSPSRSIVLMREALSESSNKVTADLHLYSVTDGLVVRSEVAEISQNFRFPVLLVVCLRLGRNNINKCYYHHLLTLLSLKNSVGIIGGRPKHSLYFIGAYGTKSLIHLDPHVAHTAVDREKIAQSWREYHCADLSRVSLDEVDPSCAAGLLIRSEKEFDSTIRTLNLNQVIDVDAGEDGQKRTSDPVFSCIPFRSPDYEGCAVTGDLSLQAEVAKQGFELL